MARGMILGHPAIGSRVVPQGTCPHPEWGQSAAAPRRGSPPTGGVYALGGSTRGSGERVVSRGWRAAEPQVGGQRQIMNISVC